MSEEFDDDGGDPPLSLLGEVLLILSDSERAESVATAAAAGRI